MVKLSSRIIIVLAIALVSFAVVGCNPTSQTTPTAERTVLTVSGSGSTQRVLTAIADAFEADTTNYQLEILPGSGTGGGVQGVADGTLDLAAMARPPKDSELEVTPDFEYIEFGLGAVALFTHVDVDVSDITSEQAVAIFTGDITNWSEVGGEDKDIVLCIRDEKDSSTVVLRETIFDDTEFAENAQTLTSQADMEAAVAGLSGSVGFGSWVAVKASDTAVNLLTIDGVSPSDPDNPSLKPLGLGYLATRQEDVQPLLDWLLSEKGQAALQAFDVVASQ
jgi:phosphate transport system substrate-binding protein